MQLLDIHHLVKIWQILQYLKNKWVKNRSIIIIKDIYINIYSIILPLFPLNLWTTLKDFVEIKLAELSSEPVAK